MESKITKMLNIRLALNRYALMRQLNINADEFRMAMYYQLLFLSFIEEFGELKNSMTDKQFAKYLAATLCLDYK